MKLVKQNNTPQANGKTTKEIGFFRKELNIYGKVALLAGYTVICLFAGANFLQPGNNFQDELDHLKSINREILKSLGSSKSSDSLSLIQSNHHLTAMIEKKVIDSLEKRENLQSKKISEQEEEIDYFKNKLQSLITRDQTERQNAHREVITLSKENMRVLRYEQGLRREEFKEEQRNELDAYMATLDRKSVIGRAKYRKFLHKQKLDLYKLEQGFVQERNDFRNKNFRLATN